MINRDQITDLIIKMGLFMNKEGKDITATQELARAINIATGGDDLLDGIYVNPGNNINVPDVVVIPLYNQDFSNYALNPNNTETCPFGYTIEIKADCFRYLTAEELTAIVLHDVLQNVLSDTAKIRFMKAYNAAISSYNPTQVLDIFKDISNSEVTFMIFMQICCRPFRVPIMEGDCFTGTEDVLKAVGLGDAYDSYLKKYYQTWIANDTKANDTSEDLVNQEIEADFRDAKTVIASCMDKDIRHYYAMVRNGVPLVTLEHIMGNPKTMTSLGFISRKRNIKRKYMPPASPSDANNDSMVAITESFMNPKTEVDLRFKVDQIISEMRYAESEAEREVILFKIKNLTLKMVKTKMDLEKKLQKDPSNKTYLSQMKTVLNFMDELNMLREKCLKMEIKQKVWRIYSKVDLPEGYEF